MRRCSLTMRMFAYFIAVEATVAPASQLDYDGFCATDGSLPHPMRQTFRGIEPREVRVYKVWRNGKHASVERLGKGNLL